MLQEEELLLHKVASQVQQDLITVQTTMAFELCKQTLEDQYRDVKRPGLPSYVKTVDKEHVNYRLKEVIHSKFKWKPGQSFKSYEIAARYETQRINELITNLKDYIGSRHSIFAPDLQAETRKRIA